MAKIDTSTIEGYAEMSAEEKIAALEGYKIPEPDLSGYVTKAAHDKTMKEASEWKEKYRGTLSESEKKNQENAAAFEAMQKELADLKREKLIAGHKAEYLAMGYDDQLAQESAEALASGDLAKVFAAQKTFMESHDKSMKAGLLKSAPTPPAGGVTGGLDYGAVIKDAMSRGDYATAAAYTRKQQETKSK